MSAVEGASPGQVDDLVAEFQGNLSLFFTRARSLWKESAVKVHPELQPAGYKLLTYIARVGSANAHQLSCTFEMDKSAISRQVRMLEEFNLIESHPDDRDGRLRVLTATAHAQQLLATIRSDRDNRIRVAVGEFAPDELRVASKVFSHLTEI